jgi:hypothetical protein
MRLTLDTCSYDLTNRALVLGAFGRLADMVRDGADIVELDRPGRQSPVPVSVPAVDESAVDLAVSTGVHLVRLPAPTPRLLALCATGGVAVVVPSGAVDDAAAAGLPPDRIVPDTVLLDVTGAPDPTAAAAVGVIRGARIVRTSQVRGTRRVCDVLAAILEVP